MLSSVVGRLLISLKMKDATYTNKDLKKSCRLDLTVGKILVMYVGESNINETLGPARTIVMREGSHF
jgi:hypothetical protein